MRAGDVVSRQNNYIPSLEGWEMMCFWADRRRRLRAIVPTDRLVWESPPSAARRDRVPSAAIEGRDFSQESAKRN